MVDGLNARRHQHRAYALRLRLPEAPPCCPSPPAAASPAASTIARTAPATSRWHRHHQATTNCTSADPVALYVRISGTIGVPPATLYGQAYPCAVCSSSSNSWDIGPGLEIVVRKRLVGQHADHHHHEERRQRYPARYDIVFDGTGADYRRLPRSTSTARRFVTLYTSTNGTLIGRRHLQHDHDHRQQLQPRCDHPAPAVEQAHRGPIDSASQLTDSTITGSRAPSPPAVKRCKLPRRLVDAGSATIGPDGGGHQGHSPRNRPRRQRRQYRHQRHRDDNRLELASDGPGTVNSGLLTSVSTLSLARPRSSPSWRAATCRRSRRRFLNDLTGNVVSHQRPPGWPVRSIRSPAAGNLIANITATGSSTHGIALASLIGHGDLGNCCVGRCIQHLVFDNVGRDHRRSRNVALDRWSCHWRRKRSLPAGRRGQRLHIRRQVDPEPEGDGNLPAGPSAINDGDAHRRQPGNSLGTFSTSRDVVHLLVGGAGRNHRGHKAAGYPGVGAFFNSGDYLLATTASPASSPPTRKYHRLADGRRVTPTSPPPSCTSRSRAVKRFNGDFTNSDVVLSGSSGKLSRAGDETADRRHPMTSTPGAGPTARQPNGNAGAPRLAQPAVRDVRNAGDHGRSGAGTHFAARQPATEHDQDHRHAGALAGDCRLDRGDCRLHRHLAHRACYLSVAGNLSSTTLAVKDGITTFTVVQAVENSTVTAATMPSPRRAPPSRR